MGNTLQTVRTALLTQVMLTTLVDDDVYTPKIPDGVDPTTGAIGFMSTDDGVISLESPQEKLIIKFACYSSSGQRARDLARVLIAALRAVSSTVHDGNRIMWVKPIGHFEDSIDESGPNNDGWPVAVGDIEVKFITGV